MGVINYLLLTDGLTILFVGLKLCGVIDWSWFWVLIFIWIYLALFVIYLLLVAFTDIFD